MYPPEPNVTPCPTFPARAHAFVARESFAICTVAGRAVMVVPAHDRGRGDAALRVGDGGRHGDRQRHGERARITAGRSGFIAEPPRESCARTPLPSPGRRMSSTRDQRKARLLRRTTVTCCNSPLRLSTRRRVDGPSPRTSIGPTRVCGRPGGGTRLPINWTLPRAGLISIPVSTLSGKAAAEISARGRGVAPLPLPAQPAPAPESASRPAEVSNTVATKRSFPAHGDRHRLSLAADAGRRRLYTGNPRAVQETRTNIGPRRPLGATRMPRRSPFAGDDARTRLPRSRCPA